MQLSFLPLRHVKRSRVYRQTSFIFLISLGCWQGCGPADPEALGPALEEGLGAQSRTLSLVGQSWQGFQLRKDGRSPNVALTSTEVALTFFENQTFELKLPSDKASFIKGNYEASPQTINLTVNEKTVDTLGSNGLRNTFHYTLKNDRLHLYNQKLEFSLAADPTDDAGPGTTPPTTPTTTTSQTSASTSLFDSWTCQGSGGGMPWRITLFSDHSFQLRTYLKEGEKLVTSSGGLTSYTKPPSERALLQLPSVRGSEPVLALTHSRDGVANKALAELFPHAKASQPSQSFDCLRL